MQLLIIRHAIAVPRGTPGVPDQDRPLTPEGEKKFREAARGLAKLVERPTRSSRAPGGARSRPRRSRPRRGAGSSPRRRPPSPAARSRSRSRCSTATPTARRWPWSATSRDVSALLARLLGTRHDDRLAFKKGGAALVDVPGRLAGGGALVLFLPPKVLRKL